MLIETEKSEHVSIPLTRARAAKCAAQHFGTWSIEPNWFRAAMDAVRSGLLVPKAMDVGGDLDAGDLGESISATQNGIATITMDGQMTKYGSSFGGCSTVAIRKAVRAAAADPAVGGIMLKISSPGGTVEGTADLASDVAAAAAQKPVHAYAEDICCSAAYWVASQANRITSNSTALIGSIGTMAILGDDTGAQEQVGIKFRVVSSTPLKGAGADGRITDALVNEVQREVNEQNAPFLAGIAAGRGSKINVTSAADGRVHVGAQAKSLGLVDGIGTLDDAMKSLVAAVSDAGGAARSSVSPNRFSASAVDDAGSAAAGAAVGKRFAAQQARCRFGESREPITATERRSAFAAAAKAGAAAGAAATLAAGPTLPASQQHDDAAIAEQARAAVARMSKRVQGTQERLEQQRAGGNHHIGDMGRLG